MVQRKVSSKLGIQAEHVKSDKHFANKKLSSLQHQDGKNRIADMKKKMKKSRSIKLSDLEAFQSSTPSSKTAVSTTSASSSPQKQHGSPNYMKPTSSSHAKKELFPVSLRNTQSSSDFKYLPRKLSSDLKATCSKKVAKTLTRLSSLSLVRTLTKTTNFKASRTCPKKSTRAAMCAADMNSPHTHKATCSSTLKDSKFPSYLMLSPGGTELEGTSVMKVCPYTYCSLNGHHHADLPPLKSFISSRRLSLKTHKRVKLEASSPRRLKAEKKVSDVEQTVFDAKPAYDEIGVEDIFSEIYANEKDAVPIREEETGKSDHFLKEDAKSTIEDDGIAAGEEDVMQAIPKFHTDFEGDLKKSFDDVAIEIEVDSKEGFLQEQNPEDADEEDHQTSWSHEEISMGSYCNDEEQTGDIDNDMNDFDSQADHMEWEDELFCGFDHDKDADSSSDFTEEDNYSKVESLSESSHDVSVTWLDDILNIYYDDIVVDETLKEAKSEERTYLEEQPQDAAEDTSGTTETHQNGYPSSDHSSFTEEIFEDLTNAADENVKQVDGEEICSMKKELDEDINDNSQCQKMSETCKFDETNEEENQTQLFDEHEERIKVVQDQEELIKDQGKGIKFQKTSCISVEEENTSEDWRGAIRRKRGAENDNDDEMRGFNPREPNFLPLVPEPEKEKVDLRHQMIDERKNAEEWMVDCALRQVVTKLAPAGKKKVALLVEAFETVMPPKCESHLKNNSAFCHARHIQACS